MEIILAKSAGFCFGVSKAVGVVQELLRDRKSPLYTFGPIIHNEQVVNELAAMGAKVVEDVNRIDVPGWVVIRAHGVPPEIYREIEKKGSQVVDATCPYVKKIHKLVKTKYEEGYKVIIIGDADHPEIKGINGWCGNSAFIVDSLEDVEKIECCREKVCVVAQTTSEREKWEKLIDVIEKKFKKVEKFDTICNATAERQKEAAEISSRVDAMIVIGGKSSSNTRKLHQICSRYCRNTYWVEDPADLPFLGGKGLGRVGVTAGASTPDWIIKEVVRRMEDLNKEEQDLNFKEAFEESIVTLRAGDAVKGKIIGFSGSEVYIDLGYKSDGVIPLEEFSDEHDFDPGKSLKVGEEIEAYVIKVNDAEGHVLLSKKRLDAAKALDRIKDSYENKTPISVKIKEVVKGGVVGVLGGYQIFIPASQLSDRYVSDLNKYVGTVETIRITEYNGPRRKYVGSRRVILEEEKARAEERLWEEIEVGKKYAGTVTSLTNFGAFVDIGGVDGLIHISELSWGRIKHPSEVLKVGDRVEVTVLEFDREKKRISLGYRKNEDNPWYRAEERYKVGDIVKGRVVRLVPFGAFVELEKGVDGLVHISQISNFRIAKPSDVLETGQEVEAKIVEADIPNKKIALSIKEVNPIDPEDKMAEKEDAESKEEDDTSLSHSEDMSLSIGEITGLKTGDEEK